MTDISRGLLATCWTHAGDARPGRGDGTSPLALRERIEATGRAGWQGFGLGSADLERALGTSSLAELRSMFEANGIEQVELEFLTDWWTDGERRAASDAPDGGRGGGAAGRGRGRGRAGRGRYRVRRG